jgi:hypothetical protein
MLTGIVIFGCSILALKVMWTVVALGISLPQLKHGCDSVGLEAASSVRRVFIVIPLLREQANLSELLSIFGSFVYSFDFISLVLVTTHREAVEKRGHSGLTTAELLERSDAFKNLPEDRRIHLHYPENNALVSEQLAYAVTRLIDDNSATEEDYILLYNADSVVSYDGVASMLVCVRNVVPAAQQSALFLKNLSRLLKANSYLAAGDALFQTGWTLAREMPRYHIGSGSVKWLPTFISNIWFAHCVSHGLLIRIGTLLSAGGYPRLRYGLEDSNLGYQLRADGTIIHPVSALEIADAPETFGSVWKQKIQWVRGPLAAVEYFTIARRRGARLGRNVLLLLEGLYNGLKWSFGLWFLMGLFGAGFATGHLRPVFALYLAYCAVPLFGVWVAVTFQPSRFASPSLLRLALVMLIYPAVPLLHGVFGFVGACSVVRQIARGEHFRQMKTEVL